MCLALVNLSTPSSVFGPAMLLFAVGLMAAFLRAVMKDMWQLLMIWACHSCHILPWKAPYFCNGFSGNNKVCVHNSVTWAVLG